MESPSSASAASRVDFYGFLDRMRRPAAAGLFRSIKRSASTHPTRRSPNEFAHCLLGSTIMASYGSNRAHPNARSFLASLSLDDPSAEEDGARVQAFYSAMEAAFREHPLWANATHQEIDHALC
ncbi:hypothetical protein QYE76_060197 [Lolium multiflorum]|uniref:RABX5 catalytic core helical domain-containing protein n=1 Tax=Lolium multiflorum TaxID=4521 RepID=A0AAD8W6A5_LOLMU|nr:hypothetical protein QYE76_060197 [Lolium multiflorum]